jgi:hypothetical protein
LGACMSCALLLTAGCVSLRLLRNDRIALVPLCTVVYNTVYL